MTEQADPQPEVAQSPARGAPVGSPLLRSDPSAAAIRNPQSNVPQSASILAVEDSPVEAELLRRSLARAGYAVTVATDGEQGLQAARAHRPALVISDINMPVMDGYQLCHALKYDDELWNVPVMLLTMLAEPEDIMRAIDAGADAYITKPFAEANLLERVRALLERTAGRKRSEERRSERVKYDGRTYTVSGGGQQALNLLLSVYKSILSQNQDLLRVQAQLNLLNESLDEEVHKRTHDLAQGEQRLHDIIEKQADSVMVLGNDGTILFMNPAAEQLFGKPAKDMLGVDFGFPLVTGEATEINIRRPGGTFADAEMRLIQTEWEGQPAFIVSLQNITERKQAEDKLKEQLAELRRWHEAMRGREMRVVELKREVNELLAEAGQPPRYESVLPPKEG